MLRQEAWAFDGAALAGHNGAAGADVAPAGKARIYELRERARIRPAISTL